MDTFEDLRIYQTVTKGDTSKTITFTFDKSYDFLTLIAISEKEIA